MVREKPVFLAVNGMTLLGKRARLLARMPGEPDEVDGRTT